MRGINLKLKFVILGLIIFNFGFGNLSAIAEQFQGNLQRSKGRFLVSDSRGLRNRGIGADAYLKGKFIVKFKPELTAVLLSSLDGNLEAKSLPNLSTIQKLLAKYGVSKITPVYRELVQEMKRRGVTERQLYSEIIKRRLGRDIKSTDKAPIFATVFLLHCDSKTEILKAINEFKKDPRVQYAEPNYIYKAVMYPNDPFYSSRGTWGQNYDDLWGLKKIQCEKAWDITQGRYPDGRPVVVAVVDTGVDYNHKDIADNIWANVKELSGNGIDDDNNGYIDDIRGWDFVGSDTNNPKQSNDPMDRMGHGTHVAGIIAAIGNNGIGVVGVAPQAKIMPVKCIDDSGSGGSDVLAEGIRYAANNGAKVINCSWGGPSSKTIAEAITYAHDQMQCVVVAAAGNDNMDSRYFGPANLTQVITVAASNQEDRKVDFSNWGLKVDVASPGGDSGSMAETPSGQHYYVNILSLRAKDTDMYKGAPNYTDGEFVIKDPNSLGYDYYRARGTSMAAPYVSGLAALVISRYPQESTQEVEARIKTTTDPFAETYLDTPIGTGRVNAYQALTTERKPYFLIEDNLLEEIEGNGNQIPESNEKAKLTVSLKNIWKDAVSVRADLSTDSKYIASIIKASANFGSIKQGEIKANTSDAFIFKIGKIPNSATSAKFTLTIHADGVNQQLYFYAILGAKRIIQLPGIKDALFISRLGEYGDARVPGISFSGNKIVYEDFNSSTRQCNIKLFDIIKNETISITNDSYDNVCPYISNNKIVYSSNKSGEKYDIYLYDLATKQTRQISSSSDYYDLYPRMSGENIVYERDLDRIFYYNLNNHKETPIRILGYMQASPVVDGTNLAYIEYPRGSIQGGHVCTLDLKSGRYRQISKYPTAVFPEIYGNNIVYNDFRNIGRSGYDIYYFGLLENQEKVVCDNDEGNKWLPDIYKNLVVWGDSRNDFPDIYLKNLDTNQELRLTDGHVYHSLPKISENKIIWWQEPGYIYMQAINTNDFDTTPPVTTISGVDNLWHNKPVTVTLAATDKGSGVDKTYYSIDGTAPSVVYKGPFKISSGFTFPVKYYSIDKAGNKEAIKESPIIKIDLIAPQGTVKINGGALSTKTRDVTLNLSATDYASGMGNGAKMQLSFDNSWSTPEAYAQTRACTLPVGYGTKLVYAKFMDVAGNWSNPVSASIQYQGNQPPVAVIGITSQQGKPGYLMVSFSGSGSKDPSGRITRYFWDFGDRNVSYQTNPVHTFINNTTVDNTFTVTLKVTDNENASGTAKVSVTVKPLPKNQLPVAKFTATPLSGNVPLRVSFNANASNDPDGRIIQYFWDFGTGNKSFQKNPGYTYVIPKVYTVTLTVTDDKFATNSTSIKITVNPKKK